MFTDYFFKIYDATDNMWYFLYSGVLAAALAKRAIDDRNECISMVDKFLKYSFGAACASGVWTAYCVIKQAKNMVIYIGPLFLLSLAVAFGDVNLFRSSREDSCLKQAVREFVELENKFYLNGTMSNTRDTSNVDFGERYKRDMVPAPLGM